MKKTITILMCLLTFQLFAQTNAIKLNIPSLICRNAYVSYERYLSENKSVALDFSVLMPRNVPTYFISDIPSEEEVESGTFDVSQFGSLDINGFSITPSIRFYTSDKGNFQGFYIEPYIRYRRFYANHAFKDSDNFDSELNMSLSKVAFGASIGSQWIINDKISIDVMWLGFELNRQTFSIDASTENPTADYAIDNQNLVDALGLIDRFFGLDLNSTTNSFDAKANAILPGFRFKFSVGYAF